MYALKKEPPFRTRVHPAALLCQCRRCKSTRQKNTHTHTRMHCASYYHHRMIIITIFICSRQRNVGAHAHGASHSTRPRALCRSPTSPSPSHRPIRPTPDQTEPTEIRETAAERRSSARTHREPHASADCLVSICSRRVRARARLAACATAQTEPNQPGQPHWRRLCTPRARVRVF